MSRLRNIKRVDSEANKTHAWFVTLQRHGRVMWKMFSDGLYGGKRKSLKAAKEYRDQVLTENPSYEHQLWVRTRIRKNNKSGIPGVARYERPANPSTGRRSAFWQAAWVDENGKSCKAKFSVSIYGEREAKRLAVSERDRQLKRVCDLKASR